MVLSVFVKVMPKLAYFTKAHQLFQPELLKNMLPWLNFCDFPEKAGREILWALPDFHKCKLPDDVYRKTPRIMLIFQTHGNECAMGFVFCAEFVVYY